MPSDRPIYVDIDGTLTDRPEGTGGKPLQDRIIAVRRLISAGYAVVVWSGGGTEYARAFCRQHSLYPLAALGKPEVAFDDNPKVRPRGIAVIDPSELESFAQKVTK